MDSGEGRFIQAKSIGDLEKIREDYPKSKGIFEVGEEIEIRGSLFKVRKITPFYMQLKLLRQPADSADSR